MASMGLEEDLSSLERTEGGWFYNGYRIQADPNAHRFVVHYISKHVQDASVLDLGSGSGALPAQLLDAGCRVSSTSWNGKCEVGDRIYEINLDNGFTPQQVGGEKFDVITAIDIIEHVENPWAFLRSCSQVLHDSGIVMVTTPNLESARARLEWLIRGFTSDYSQEQIANNRHISPIWRNGFLAMAAQAGLGVKDQFAFGRYARNSTLMKYLFLLVEKLLPEHASGTTTLYVLSRTGDALALGPDVIY